MQDHDASAESLFARLSRSKSWRKVEVMSVLEHLWTLCFWWASWSLCDRYFIRFTPWSELLVLAVCALTYGARRVPQACDRVEQGLAAATQSHPGVQNPPYDAQKDVA